MHRSLEADNFMEIQNNADMALTSRFDEDEEIIVSPARYLEEMM